jgi:hypothetical protein
MLNLAKSRGTTAKTIKPIGNTGRFESIFASTATKAIIPKIAPLISASTNRRLRPYRNVEVIECVDFNP